MVNVKQGPGKETKELYGVLILIGSVFGFYLLFILAQYIFIGEIVWWE